MQTRIKEYRTRMNLTQEDLAKIVGSGGRPSSSLNRANIILRSGSPMMWHKPCIQASITFLSSMTMAQHRKNVSFSSISRDRFRITRFLIEQDP